MRPRSGRSGRRRGSQNAGIGTGLVTAGPCGCAHTGTLVGSKIASPRLATSTTLPSFREWIPVTRFLF